MNSIVFTSLLFFMAGFASNASGQQNANNFLINFTLEETLAVVTCIGEAGDPILCEDYLQCLAVMPAVTVRTYEQCSQQMNLTENAIQCTPQGASIAPLATRRQVVRCIDENTPLETDEDRLALLQMEDCMRRIEARCQRN